MRSAAPFSFVDWRSAAAHQRVQAPTVHTVVIGIDRRPSMRDIAMFGEQTGFIAVDSADLATFMLAKTVAYSMRPEGRDICFAPVHKGKDMADAGGLVMLPADSPQLRDWRVAIDGNESVVSIVGHASEDYLRLSSEELVCGRRSVRRPDRSGNRLPTCMIDGGCVLPGLRRTGPEDLPGAVFFSNACLSLKVDGGIFDGGDSYTVSQRFLEANAAAFVASPLLKDGRVEENLVFHGLMGAGLTLGQTVRELNRFLREWHFEAGKVLILGDPSIRTSTHLASGMSTQFKKGLLFGAKDEAPHLPDEDCCVADAPPRAVSGFVRGDAVPGSRAILLDRPPKTDSEPRIVPRPVTPEDALRRIRQILDQYDRVALLDVKIGEGRQLLTDFRKSYPNLVRRAAISRCGAPLDSALCRSLDRLAVATRTVDRGLVAKLRRETFKSEYHFVEAYRDAYKTADVSAVAEGCPNCGSDAVRYEFVAFGDASARRWLVSCVVCGAVQDGVPEFVVSRIATLEAGPEGGTLRGETHLRNESAHAVDLALGGAVTHGRKHDASVSVARDQFLLAAGESVTVPFEVRVPSPEDRHPMFLRMYAVSEGRVSFSGREFFV